MRKHKWIIDATLVVIIVVLAVFVVLEMRRMINFIRRDQETPTPQESENMINETKPTLIPQLEEKHTSNVLAPDFELVNLEGERVTLSDFRGKAVLVNFWATWCPPCRAEMPLIDEFAEQHTQELVVLAVNAGEGESEVRSFIQAHDLDFVFLLDLENSVATLYRVRGFPTSLFIDPQGQLQATHIGELNAKLMANYLKKIGINE